MKITKRQHPTMARATEVIISWDESDQTQTTLVLFVGIEQEKMAEEYVKHLEDVNAAKLDTSNSSANVPNP